MNILITGATGLIGSELVNFLLAQNHTVHYLTTSKNKVKTTQNLKGFYWNIDRKIIDENCIKGVNVIVHLAGASINQRWTKSYKEQIIQSRVQSAALLYKLLKNSNHIVNHFISASGTAIYPESFDTHYNEDSQETDNRFLADVVQQWEQAANSFTEFGITVTKVRTGVVFASQNSALQEIVKPIKMGFAAALGNGKQLLSWIHIKDLVNVYYYIINHKVEGVVNAVSPNPISNKNLTQQLAHHLKTPYFLPNVPQFLLKIVLGERSIIALKSEKIQPKKLLQLNFHFTYPTVREALNDVL